MPMTWQVNSQDVVHQQITQHIKSPRNEVNNKLLLRDNTVQWNIHSQAVYLIKTIFKYTVKAVMSTAGDEQRIDFQDTAIIGERTNFSNATAIEENQFSNS